MVGVATGWAALLLLGLLRAQDPEPDHPINDWVKRTPGAGSPVSPRLGYEGACGWDPLRRRLIRYGGHNQGGGGEQNSEIWIHDPRTRSWTLKEPNRAPPGVCCAQQDVFDPESARLVCFPAFSGSHGWQWQREIYLNQSSAWTYDSETNLWRNRRPLPAPRLAPLRCASYDTDRQVVVVFGGEGSGEGTLVYDPYANSWTWMKPPKEPEPRSGGNMAYDAAHRLHILFGSQFGKDPRTWAYDLAKNEWRDLAPVGQPPSDQNDAVLAYDPASRKVLALVMITEGKGDSAKHRLETWALDVEEKAWTRMNPAHEPEAGGARSRVLVAAPGDNLIYLENCTSRPREQQVWSYRLKQGGAPGGETPRAKRAAPGAPEDVVVSVVGPGEVEITWRPGKGAPEGELRYAVERAPAEVYTEDQLRRLKSRTAPLAQPSAGALRKVGAFQALGAEPAGGLSLTDRNVDLSKPAVLGGDLVYDRARSKEEVDPEGKPYRFGVYAYRVRAVNKDGVRGGPSEAVFTLPSAPSWVFLKEEGASARLKWAGNPEKGIRGYRVYRMDGRFDKEPVSRLSEDPIAEAAFLDEKADRKTRRYYIVAVDALGQEGFPSMPVWYEREWKAFYKPFTGEWHQ